MQAAIASKLAPTGGSLRPRIGRTSLRVRPRPRRGLCCPPASMRAAVGVRRPLPQKSDSDRRLGAVPVGAALAAMQLLPSAGFDMSRCRGQKTPPTAPRRRPPIGRDPCESDLCGSGLGRDTVVAVRRLRCRPLSGSEDPSHRTSAPTADGTRFLWERSSDRDSAVAGRRLRFRLLSRASSLPRNRRQPRSHEIGVSRAGRARCAGRNRTTHCPAWRRDWGRR